jgi:hypothetical protein
VTFLGKWQLPRTTCKMLVQWHERRNSGQRPRSRPRASTKRRPMSLPGDLDSLTSDQELVHVAKQPRFQTSAQPWPPVVLVAPFSKVYHVPAGSASVGVGWPKSAHRSLKCDCVAALSVRVDAFHLSMNCCGPLELCVMGRVYLLSSRQLLRQVFIFSWCRGSESNRHGVATTGF